MTPFLAFVLGFCVAFVLISDMSGQTVSLDECRATNPGFDCNLGWVRGEAY